MKGTTTLDIAVLLTCYNRRQKTLAFLESLTTQQGYADLQITIYLLDDASTDYTAGAVKEQYPFINIIQGNGSLFWAGGMRRVWQYAMAQKMHNLYLLFNDDIVLFNGALNRLLSCYSGLNKTGVVLIGSALDPDTNKLSYGGYLLNQPGHSKYYVIEPNERDVRPCQLANANILLVDAQTVNTIGIFDEAYTHFMADFDYSLAAIKAGLAVLIAPGYYAFCKNDHGVNWLSGKHHLKKRIAYLYSPTGLAYKDYLFYIRKNFPADYIASIIKLWMKTLFPIIWEKFKKRD